MDTIKSKQAEILELLRNPDTGNVLVPENGDLVDREVGERFSIREGIPVILRKADVFGWNRKSQRGYDLGSFLYDLLYRYNLMNLKKWLAEIAEIMEAKSGDYILETSIGTGQQLLNLKNHGVVGHFFGNDISFGMLRKCIKNLETWGIDAGLVQGNAEALPFAGGIFDVVFHVGGFNFFNDKEKAIREMIRVGKPGSKIYLVDESIELARPPRWLAWFLPKPNSDVYAPPLKYIPGEMLEVRDYKILDEKFWMVAFQKPLA